MTSGSNHQETHPIVNSKSQETGGWGGGAEGLEETFFAVD